MKLKTRKNNTQENLLTVINTIINPINRKLSINTLTYNFSYIDNKGETKKPTNNVLL